ncbi:hypothetical protein [Adonisia turfae]
MNLKNPMKIITLLLLGTSVIYSSCVSLDADKQVPADTTESRIEGSTETQGGSKPTPVPPVKTGNSEEMLLAVFDAFEKEKHEIAIVQADLCISNFEGDALRRQKAFTESGEPSPPTQPQTDTEKQEVFARGPLNDVAGCYFMKGEALTALSENAKAREAYIGAEQFPAARIWSEDGFFWEPAQAASDRLAQLNESS